MIKLEFRNVVAEDYGLGVRVDGRSLESIISTALGTAVTTAGGLRVSNNVFRSNSCDITVIIDPQPTSVRIEDGNNVFKSVGDLEECRYEQFKKEDETQNTEN